MTQKTAIVKDEIYLQHLTGDYHPENHHRLEVVYEMLQEEEMQGKFRELPPRPATRETTRCAPHVSAEKRGFPIGSS